MQTALQLTQMQPERPPDAELLREAAKAFRRGDQDRARWLVGGAIALNPENETAWLLRGSLATSVREANACLKQVLWLNPEHAKAQELLKKVETAASRQSETLDLTEARPPSKISKAVPAKSSEPKATKGSGRLAWQCPICESESEKPQPICNRCNCIVDLGRVDEIASHEGGDRERLLASIETLSSRESDFTGCIALALAHLNLKNSQQAVEQLEQAQQHRPEDVALTDVISQIKRRPLVMVIDKNEEVREQVSGALEKRLFRVTGVSDALQAFHVLEHEMPQLFFVDTDARVIDGYQICQILKKNRQERGFSLILLTEDGGLVERARGVIAGAQGYLPKPFTEEVLVETVLSSLS